MKGSANFVQTNMISSDIKGHLHKMRAEWTKKFHPVHNAYVALSASYL